MMNRLAMVQAGFPGDAPQKRPPHPAKKKGDAASHLRDAKAKHAAGDHQGAKLAALRAANALHAQTRAAGSTGSAC